MRKLVLSICLLFASISFAGEYVIKWKVSGHKVKTEFKTKILTSSNQQTITHSFPPGFSFSLIMTGTQQVHLDRISFAAATPVTTITFGENSTIQIENNGVSVQAVSLLNLMYTALQSPPGTTIAVSGQVSLGISPISLLPGRNDFLDQITSNGITVNGNTVHTNLHVSYGADYGLILEQVNDGFRLILTHSAIEDENIQEIINDTHDEGIEGDGLHEEATFSVFIPTSAMLALTGSETTVSQPNLATITTGAAILLTAATAAAKPMR